MRRNPRPRAWPADTKWFSEFGEDRILSEIFAGTTKGVCVEVGGNDGISGSTSLAFERLGWRCVVVEPIAELCAQMRRTRAPETAIVEAAASDHASAAQTFYVGDTVEMLSTLKDDPGHLALIRQFGGTVRETTVRTDTLDSLLSPHLSGPIDFVTVDVEGSELDALRGFSLPRWSPRIVILEDETEGRDPGIGDHMRQHGYVRFRRTGANDWYARKTDTALATRAATLEMNARHAIKSTLPPGALDAARRLRRAVRRLAK